MKMRLVPMEKILAICDHFEGENGQPVRASILKRAAGITRQDLRVLERERRLDVVEIQNYKGVLEKHYSSPKNRLSNFQLKDQIEVFSNGTYIGVAQGLSVR